VLRHETHWIGRKQPFIFTETVPSLCVSEIMRDPAVVSTAPVVLGAPFVAFIILISPSTSRNKVLDGNSKTF
jgi:hypothetical protein